ncbi:MAG: hypothetical protein KDC95_13130 [Planctomycetes bacterium]|nr:hypothetical protein [Planctomycetota bacterium]
MSLNGYLAFAAALLLPVSPFVLIASPWIVFRRRRARALAREAGYAQLDTTMVRCLEACTKAMIRADSAGNAIEAERAVRDIDRFLDLSYSSRTWRTKALILAVEHAPRLTYWRPFSELSADQARAFVDHRLATTKGLYGTISLVRQLVRLGYYASDSARSSIGFVPFAERNKQRKSAKPTPALQV